MSKIRMIVNIDTELIERVNDAVHAAKKLGVIKSRSALVSLAINMLLDSDELMAILMGVDEVLEGDEVFAE